MIIHMATSPTDLLALIPPSLMLPQLVRTMGYHMERRQRTMLSFQACPLSKSPPTDSRTEVNASPPLPVLASPSEVAPYLPSPVTTPLTAGGVLR